MIYTRIRYKSDKIGETLKKNNPKSKIILKVVIKSLRITKSIKSNKFISFTHILLYRNLTYRQVITCFVTQLYSGS